ncbi:hypothetical protein CSA56_13460 [candidate division KSB3 bacterium]|uniref:HEAT repeat domain-containing protein n=1 Tax=candidate division KSB3 bacterium TaxID=2044937 RepID=A0A2G6KBK3_9BACT|nr:MAG: hypothetical protein CSA56_13460 [candidate division KSB3 bacterium]
MDNHMDVLLQHLKDPDPDTRRQGISELERVAVGAGRQDAIRQLIPLLGDPEVPVRDAAENALLSFGGRDVVSELVPRLSDPSTTIVNYTVEILSKIGDAAIENILPLLESRDHDIRKFGCDILGNLRYADSLYELIDLLNDPHVNVAIAAGEALGKIGNAEAVPYLIQALRHPDTWMKCIATEALGKIGDQRAVDPFIGLSMYEDPIVLYTVIKAMGNFQDQRVLPYILTILHSNPVFAPSAAQAIESLVNIQGEHIYQEVKTVGVGEHFLRLLSHDNKDILRSAVTIVGHLHMAEAVEPLKTLLFHMLEQQADENLRRDVVTAFGMTVRESPQLQELHGESVVERLSETIQHKDRTLQMAAIDTLCTMVPYLASVSKAVPMLQELMATTTDEGLRASLHKALPLLEAR